MKTCRHCLSTDVPDEATRCAHCGGRLTASKAPAIIVVVIVVVIVGVIGVMELRRANEVDSQRMELRTEMDAMKQVCSPSSLEEVVDDATATFQQRVQASSLEFDEKERLLTAWDNNLEVGGCGFNARHQAKPAKRRR